MNALPDPDEWYEDALGIPRPNWTAIDDWILEEVEAEDFDEAWAATTENWLRRVQLAYGPKFTVVSSANFQLLSPYTERESEGALKFAEKFFQSMSAALGDLQVMRFGKMPVLRFATAEDYYRYIAHFGPEDAEQPTSGGVFLDDGFPHIVCQSFMYENFCTTLVHETSHLLVRHLPLPLWVNEGLAMAFESQAGFSHAPDREKVLKHRAYWDEDTIQTFWSGESFGSPGEAFELSYGLATTLFEIIHKELSPPPAAFRAFIGAAQRDDGGASAAEEHLRAELGEIVEVFLGPGEWNPRPGW